MSQSIELARLKALKRYEVLDTPPDGAYDCITAIASKMFNMPIALITLVDEDRIWFKSKYGLDDPNQIPKEPGLCASAILSDEVYVVENAKQDPRTLENQLVKGDFGLEFYAAAPLKTRGGHRIGNFCVIDKKPRYLNTEQISLLEDLAQIVVDQFELRLNALNEVRQMKEKINTLKKRLHLESET